MSSRSLLQIAIMVFGSEEAAHQRNRSGGPLTHLEAISVVAAKLDVIMTCLGRRKIATRIYSRDFGILIGILISILILHPSAF